MQADLRKIIHIDMDAFFASVEQRDNCDLRGKPVAVGGAPGSRGVVAAASYEARKFGIHSAMPSSIAARRCPGLIFIQPRFEVYKEVSTIIRDIFHEYTELVEPLSLDEAYLDVTNNLVGNPSATLIAKEIKSKIKASTDLTASAGVSVNKFLAKTASAMKKPDGFFLIPPDEASRFVETLPIEKFHGIGRVTAQKMREEGIANGADLKRWSRIDLISRFGRAGNYFYEIARGEDHRPVCPDHIRKSVGVENSFAEDLEGLHSIGEELAKLTDTLVARINKSSVSGRTITLKVKYADYTQVTRSRTSSIPFDSEQTIKATAIELLKQTECASRRIRLLGLALSNLEGDERGGEVIQLRLELGLNR